MMGPTKLSTMRAELRKAFGMSDAELQAWFDRRVEASTADAPASSTAIETLELLRDALLREVKRSKPPRRGNAVRRRPAG